MVFEDYVIYKQLSVFEDDILVIAYTDIWKRYSSNNLCRYLKMIY